MNSILKVFKDGEKKNFQFKQIMRTLKGYEKKGSIQKLGKEVLIYT